MTAKFVTQAERRQWQACDHTEATLGPVESMAKSWLLAVCSQMDS